MQWIRVHDPCMPVHPDQRCTVPSDEGSEALGRKCWAPEAFRCDKNPYCAAPDIPYDKISAGVGGTLKCRYW